MTVLRAAPEYGVEGWAEGETGVTVEVQKGHLCWKDSGVQQLWALDDEVQVRPKRGCVISIRQREDSLGERSWFCPKRKPNA